MTDQDSQYQSKHHENSGKPYRRLGEMTSGFAAEHRLTDTPECGTHAAGLRRLDEDQTDKQQRNHHHQSIQKHDQD